MLFPVIVTRPVGVGAFFEALALMVPPTGIFVSARPSGREGSVTSSSLERLKSIEGELQELAKPVGRPGRAAGGGLTSRKKMETLAPSAWMLGSVGLGAAGTAVPRKRMTSG